MSRYIDISLSFFLIILFSPVLVFLYILVAVILSQQVFFKQLRAGKDEKLFAIYKFKTMKDIYDDSGKLLPDEKRLTRFGTLLRKTSLDELPQLWNVLKGDMSFIGPRPLLPEYLPLYNDFQKRRHEVKPGITGWAQVNGRNAISWEEKFKLDVWYVENRNTFLDLKILFMTIKKVILRKNIASAGSVTMEKFTG